MNNNRRSVWKVAIPFLSLLLLIVGVVIGIKSRNTITSHLSEGGQLKVFVSILPQKYFVERIGGEKVAVSVLVGPGQNPATYEPLPKQMAALTEANIYFRIGVPFEMVWIDKIQALNPQLLIVDTREGIKLRAMEGAHEHNEVEAGSEDHDHGSLTTKEVKDPHIWLDPLLVKIQAQTICRELSNIDPINKRFYEQNLRNFCADLDRLHWEMAATFQTLTVKKLMVFHPAWGYLTERYGLQQIPIEVAGKEPGPQELAQVIEQAKQEGIKVIFIQAQFSTEAALSVARAVEGKVVAIDPLAEDYISNLRMIAETIKKGF